MSVPTPQDPAPVPDAPTPAPTPPDAGGAHTAPDPVALADSLRRCVDSLDDLIRYCDDPGTEALGAVYEARALLGWTPPKRAATGPALADIAPGLIDLLRDAGDEWGPLGVAVAAARLTDVDVLVRQLTDGKAPATEVDARHVVAEDRWTPFIAAEKFPQQDRSCWVHLASGRVLTARWSVMGGWQTTNGGATDDSPVTHWRYVVAPEPPTASDWEDVAPEDRPDAVEARRRAAAADTLDVPGRL
jgi:hypothetical protein